MDDNFTLDTAPVSLISVCLNASRHFKALQCGTDMTDGPGAGIAHKHSVPLYETVDEALAIGADGDISVSSPAASTLADRIMCCWNCGSSQHMASECPQPHDRSTFNERRRVFMRFRELQGSSSRSTASRYHTQGALEGGGEPEPTPPRRRRDDGETVQLHPSAPPTHISLPVQDLLCLPTYTRSHRERLPRQLLRRQRRLGYPPGYLPPPSPQSRAVLKNKHQQLWQGRLAALGAEAQAALQGWWGPNAGEVASGPNEYPPRRAPAPPCPTLVWQSHRHQQALLPALSKDAETGSGGAVSVRLPSQLRGHGPMLLPVCTCGAPIQAHAPIQVQQGSNGICADTDSDEGEVAAPKGVQGGSSTEAPPIPGLTHHAGFNTQSNAGQLSAVHDALGVYLDSRHLGEDLPSVTVPADASGPKAAPAWSATAGTPSIGAVPVWILGSTGGIVPPLHPQRVCAAHGGRASMLCASPGRAWAHAVPLLPFNPAPSTERRKRMEQLPRRLQGPLQPVAAIGPLPGFDSSDATGGGAARDSLNVLLQGLDMPHHDHGTQAQAGDEDTPWGRTAAVHGIHSAFLPLSLHVAVEPVAGIESPSYSRMSVSSAGGGSCGGSAQQALSDGAGSAGTAVEAATQVDGAASDTSSEAGSGAVAGAGGTGVANMCDAVADEAVDAEDRDVIAAAEHAARWA